MGEVDKVVIVVFDGLRPDMIAGRMPTLAAFLGDNLWFGNARSVFPSLTRVCSASVSTGAWPGRHGIVNNEFHLNGDLGGPVVDTAGLDHLVALAERTGAIVTADSLGQRLAAAGRSMMAIHCGSAGSGLLVNHAVRDVGQRTFSIHGAEATLTPEIVAEVLATCGPLPAQDVPKLDVVAYTGRVATEVALAQDQADVTLVWLPEPDTSFHFCGIHSEGANQAMAAADAAFAEILGAVADGAHGSHTAVIAMSDHGQIATSALIDLTGLLRADGFRAGEAPGGDTDILITGGNMGELRPIAPDRGLIADLGHWLMQQGEIGMVFADPEMVAGALPLSAVHQTHVRSAPISYVMRSDGTPGPGGIPGIGVYTGGVPLGGGMHGGLNRYEMNITLGVGTPAGRRGEIDDAPASLIDIAPTVLSLFGMDGDTDGRVLPLFEPDAETARTTTLRAASGGFEQQLVRASIAGRDYLIEGGRV
ncbi:MAG TPA: nucleotide pyrophosphatase [Rhodobacteraceae bacterium]|nr:nucleotide pyrophosphatase [Paracoccaceae bacterium]